MSISFPNHDEEPEGKIIHGKIMILPAMILPLPFGGNKNRFHESLPASRRRKPMLENFKLQVPNSKETPSPQYPSQRVRRLFGSRGSAVAWSLEFEVSLDSGV
jgi:hypothetical protein